MRKLKKRKESPKDNRNDQMKIQPFMVLKSRISISFIILIIYMLFTILHIGCPIQFTAGISCPGCGMTRAVTSVLHLDFKEAFYFHPLFFLAPFMFGLFIFEAYLNPLFVKTSWIVIILAFIIVYFIRLFITENDVVKIDISANIVLKLLHKINVGGFK